MADCVEKEELGHNEGLDDHDGRSSQDEHEADDVYSTHDVQDGEARASLGRLLLYLLLETEHDDSVEK